MDQWKQIVHKWKVAIQDLLMRMKLFLQRILLNSQDTIENLKTSKTRKTLITNQKIDKNQSEKE